MQNELGAQEMLDAVANETNIEAKTPEAGTPTSQPESTEKEPQMFEYDAAGKRIKEPLEMVLKRASMGYDYAQRMEQIKKQSAEFETIKQQNAELSKWSEYDKFAKENPKWAEHVKDMWEKRQTMSDPNIDPSDPVIGKLSALEQMLNSKLSEFGTKFQTYDQWIASQQTAQEDQTFSKEIAGVRSSYPDVDFDGRDEMGKSLEMQVLEHMRDNNIPSFRAGFRDFYHDKLLESAKLKAKDQVASSVQKNHKQGILHGSTQPAQASTSLNYSRMSYDDLAEMAKKEMVSK
jgi:hypothetical protein